MSSSGTGRCFSEIPYTRIYNGELKSYLSTSGFFFLRAEPKTIEDPNRIGELICSQLSYP